MIPDGAAELFPFSEIEELEREHLQTSQAEKEAEKL